MSNNHRDTEGYPPSFLAESGGEAVSGTPPVTKSGSPAKDIGTHMEKAFWAFAEPYTGMRGVDMEKSSHGRAFIAGWESAIKHIMEWKSDIQP